MGELVIITVEGGVASVADKSNKDIEVQIIDFDDDSEAAEEELERALVQISKMRPWASGKDDTLSELDDALIMIGMKQPENGLVETWGDPIEVEVPQGGTAARRDAYAPRCPECQTGVLSQDVDYCPSCYRAISWVGSRIADKRARQLRRRKIDAGAKKTGAPIYAAKVFLQMGFTDTIVVGAVAVANALSAKAYITSGYGKPLDKDQLRLIATKLDNRVYTYEELLVKIKAMPDTGGNLVRHFLAFIQGDFKDKPKTKEDASIAMMKRSSDA